MTDQWKARTRPRCGAPPSSRQRALRDGPRGETSRNRGRSGFCFRANCSRLLASWLLSGYPPPTLSPVSLLTGSKGITNGRSRLPDPSWGRIFHLGAPARPCRAQIAKKKNMHINSESFSWGLIVKSAPFTEQESFILINCSLFLQIAAIGKPLGGRWNTAGRGSRFYPSAPGSRYNAGEMLPLADFSIDLTFRYGEKIGSTQAKTSTSFIDRHLKKRGGFCGGQLGVIYDLFARQLSQASVGVLFCFVCSPLRRRPRLHVSHPFCLQRRRGNTCDCGCASAALGRAGCAARTGQRARVLQLQTRGGQEMTSYGGTQSTMKHRESRCSHLMPRWQVWWNGVVQVNINADVPSVVLTQLVLLACAAAADGGKHPPLGGSWSHGRFSSSKIHETHGDVHWWKRRVEKAGSGGQM